MTDAASTARRALASLDLTDLNDDCTLDAVHRLCSRAVTPFGSVAAVCVWPRFVRDAVLALMDTDVKVATVVNFPSGDEPLADILTVTRSAIADGADDIDLVLPYRAFLAGDTARVEQVVSAVREVVVAPRQMKVILETGELVHLDVIADAARLAIAGGADFIKTSTGKSKVSATPEAVRTMLDVIATSSRSVGIKPSGGIRSVSDAAVYLMLADDVMGESWATPDTFRFGASGLLDAILDVLEHS